MKLYLGLALLATTVARKAPKKFESAKEMTLVIPGSRRRRVCSHRTKWTLRCVAVSLLHNAFKAPAAQFVVYAVLVALYARTRVLKMTGKKGYYREEKTE